MELNLLYYSEQVLNTAKKLQKTYLYLNLKEALEIVEIGVEHAKADVLQKIHFDGLEIYTKNEVPLLMRESEIKVDLAGSLDVLRELSTQEEAE